MDSFEYIEDYFKRQAPREQQDSFEDRILKDKDFAEEVAFYLNTIQVARALNDEDKKKRFKEIYYEDNPPESVTPVKKLWPYAVLMAAVLSALFFGLYLYTQPGNPPKIADEYFSTNLNRLGVQMGNSSDLLQVGKNQYNMKDYKGSLKSFEALVQKDSANYDAKEDAGIAALRMSDFEKALLYFRQVANNDELKENPGKFYQALTLMKRNQPGDKKQYHKLLQEVINENLFGKSDAEKFLKEL